MKRFKEWLQNKVIDLEVANEQPSPTVDPSVRTILIGHSMGGIVAAETVLSICQDQPISGSGEMTSNDGSTFMFPYIQGVLAFDTPYLGLSPGVVAHGAEGHFNQASSAYSTYTSMANAFNWGSKSEASLANSAEANKLLPAATSGGAEASVDAAASPAWQRWGRYAMFAGAAGAVAAGGVAAYMNRNNISESMNWVGSHLEFVGCLAKGAELDQRLQAIMDLEDDHDFGFLNMYTALGKAVEGKSSWSSGVLGDQRTFCSLPKNSQRLSYFIKAKNDAATDEISAHQAMFGPRTNPGYHSMAEFARDTLVSWARSSWYSEATIDEAKLTCGDDVEIVDGPGEVQAMDEEPATWKDEEPNAWKTQEPNVWKDDGA